MQSGGRVDAGGCVCKRVVEFVEMTREPGSLLCRQLQSTRVNVGELPHAPDAHRRLARIRAVVFKNVATGDLRLGVLPRHQAFDVDAVWVRFDPFDQ